MTTTTTYRYSICTDTDHVGGAKTLDAACKRAEKESRKSGKRNVHVVEHSPTGSQSTIRTYHLGRVVTE